MSPIEHQIIDRLLTDAIASGCLVDANDGEETFIRKSADKTAIMEDLGSTGIDVLTFHRDGRRIGCVCLIYSGDKDVISDTSVSPEMDAILAGCSRLAA